MKTELIQQQETARLSMAIAPNLEYLGSGK